MQAIRNTWGVLIGLMAMVASAAAAAGAQLPGVPVLQNAFSHPGLGIAADAGGGSGSSAYALAAGWAPSGMFEVSGGLGVQTLSGVGSKSRGAYGVRAAATFGGGAAATTGSGVGFSVFAGIGGAAGTSKTDSIGAATLTPLGASIGYAHMLGGRSISAYLSPMYEYYRASPYSGGLFRTSIGLDLGLAPTFGVTIGTELGQTAPHGAGLAGAPTGTLWGVGLSYALRR